MMAKGDEINQADEEVLKQLVLAWAALNDNKGKQEADQKSSPQSHHATSRTPWTTSRDGVPVDRSGW
jgi:hypothetical protein